MLAAWVMSSGFTTLAPAIIARAGPSLPIVMSLDFEGMRASSLKALLKARSISTEGCLDKASLVERAVMYRELLESPPPSAPWSGPEPIEQGSSSAEAACLILLHGFGDTGSGFISSLGGPLIQMDGLRVVFPSAPSQQLGGFALSSWLRVDSPGSPAAAAGRMMRADPSDVQPSVDYIHSLIHREMARGVPCERIVLGGFSQGGLIATRAALSFEGGTLGGVLALSTFFGDETATLAKANQALRVLVAHGEADNVVPLSEGRRVVTSVQRLAPRAQVKFRSYAGMGHATCDQEVRDIRAFLQSVISTEETAPGAAAAAGPAAERAGQSEASPMELEAMSTARLKAYLLARGVPTADCFERADLMARAQQRSG